MRTARAPRLAALAFALLALVSLCAACSDAGGGAVADSAPWNPDLGDGRYVNPVLFADYSDPDVIRVGDDFYLTSSSFNAVPGLPILHSRDLVSWTIAGHALERLPAPRFDAVRPGEGVWAPSLRYHDGWYWIFFGDPDAGIFRTRARNPLGPWEPIQLVAEARGWIDPCPFWDDDGQAYLVHAFARSRAGIAHQLTIHRMDADGTRLLDAGQIAFDGHDLKAPFIEGPKLLKRDGTYYILAPAGGVPDGWQLALRSPSPLGPYQAKRVLERGATPINGPHQGGLVELASGESWFLHFQDRGPYGRVVHLQPVTWSDGWPLMGVDQDADGVGEPVSEHAKPDVGGAERAAPPSVPATSDEFESGTLGLQWQWPANPRDEWYSLIARRGWLRLFAQDVPTGTRNLWTVPNLLLQKLPAPFFAAIADIDASGLAAGERVALVMMGEAHSYVAIERAADGGLRLVKASCPNASAGGHENVEAEAASPTARVRLSVEVDAYARCRFGVVSAGGAFTELGEPFDAIPGRWIGAKVGLVALRSGGGAGPSGFADVAWFRVE